MFGEKISESPRVPSPWGAPRRSSATPPRTQATRSPSSSQPRQGSSVSPLRNSQNNSPLGSSSSLPKSQSDFTSPKDHLLLDAVPAAAASPVSSGGNSFSTKATVRTAPAPAIAVSPASREDGINGEPDASVSARLRPEPDEMGNLEYKLRLLPTTRRRYDRLLTQLKWRLLQGGGVCTYEVGVLDDGRCVGICEAEMRVSLEVLGALAAELDACVRIRRAFAVETVEHAANGTPSTRAAPGNASDNKSSEAGTSLRCLSSETVKQRLLDEQAIEESDSSSGCAGGCLFGSGEIGPGPGQQITTEGKGPISVFIASRPDIDGSPSSSSRRFANVDVDIEREEQDDEPEHFSTAADGDSSIRASGTAHPHDSSSNELFGEVFQPDDDELADFTFSLSLDERETRDGVGYRKPPKKKQPQQKDSEIEAKMLGLAPPSTTATDQPRPTGSSAVEASAAAKTTPHQLSSDAVSAQQSTTTAAPSQQADTPKAACRRVIVEAVVTKTVAEEAFIDYASL